MTSTLFLATAALVFMGRFVSTSRTNATPSRARMEGPALMAWERIDATAQWVTLDRTARYSERVVIAICCEIPLHFDLCS